MRGQNKRHQLHNRLRPIAMYLPNTEDLNKEVTGETCPEHLRDDEHVQHQHRPQHDRHIRGIEELDGVRSPLTTELVALNGISMWNPWK